MGLLGADGRGLPLQLEGRSRGRGTEPCWCWTRPSRPSPSSTSTATPVPSLLRGFSAPVLLDDGLDDAALLVLLAHDADAFNRWEAGQRLALARLLARCRATAHARTLDDAYLQAMRRVLRDPRWTPPSRPWC
jgi:aminopeptidase N